MINAASFSMVTVVVQQLRMYEGHRTFLLQDLLSQRKSRFYLTVQTNLYQHVVLSFLGFRLHSF